MRTGDAEVDQRSAPGRLEPLGASAQGEATPAACHDQGSTGSLRQGLGGGNEGVGGAHGVGAEDESSERGHPSPLVRL